MIAIKSLRLYDRPGDSGDKEKIFKRAARELYHWSKLMHPNVLPLMGLSLFRGRLSMISEWMEHGSMLSYLSLNPAANRIRLCIDVCFGLSYIHASHMAHGDLKAANVMISRNGTALIADFGNAQLRDLTLKFTNTTGAGLSVRWAAPELLDEDDCPPATMEADIYAYGMTVLETITGDVPYHDCSEQQVLRLVAVDHKTPGRPASGISEKIWRILQDCWAWKQSERPNIDNVKERLLASYMEETKVPHSSDENRSRVSVRGTSLPEAGGAAIANDVGMGGPSRGLKAMVGLAATHYGQGRLSEAEFLYVEAVAALERECGPSHKDTLQSMAMLAVIYHKQARLAEAELAGVEALAAQKSVLGDRHPNTLQTMTNLAATYHCQGQLKKAELLVFETLKAQKQVLGEHHPDTLQSMTNLAATYLNQGRIGEAESMGTMALNAQEKILGRHHTDTLQTMENLATTYLYQGREAEAMCLDAEVRLGKATQGRVRTA